MRNEVWQAFCWFFQEPGVIKAGNRRDMTVPVYAWTDAKYLVLGLSLIIVQLIFSVTLSVPRVNSTFCWYLPALRKYIANSFPMPDEHPLPRSFLKKFLQPSFKSHEIDQTSWRGVAHPPGFRWTCWRRGKPLEFKFFGILITLKIFPLLARG